MLAVVDLPRAAVRRHVQAGRIPELLEDEVATAARALLTDLSGEPHSQ